MSPAGVARTIHIGEVVRNARVFQFRDPRGASPMKDSELLAVVDHLFALLAERRIDYLLVGGIALLQYVEGRNTEDIDLLLATRDLERLPEIEILRRDGDFARGTFAGLQVDFLLTGNALFDHVHRHQATRRLFAEREIPCATVEGLMLLKLYALPSLYRQRNFSRVGLYENDLATLLHDYRPQIPPLWAELEKHLSATDLQELRKILADLEQRIARFEGRQDGSGD